MKFLSDENVDARLVRWLRGLGHDVAVAAKGIRSSELFSLAKRLRRILVTNDTDFLNTLIYRPKNLPGIIVLRIFKPTLDKQRRAFLVLLGQYRKDLFRKTIELFGEGFRIHK